MLSLSATSQNSTAEQQDTDSLKSKTLIDTDLLPLWYVTILQLQESEVVIDSLRASLDLAGNTIKYQVGQIGNLKKQTDNLNAMNKNLRDQNKLLSSDADSLTKFYIRWRNVGRISIGVAAALAIIVLAK